MLREVIRFRKRNQVCGVRRVEHMDEGYTVSLGHTQDKTRRLQTLEVDFKSGTHDV
jgi:hypothetical protein